MKLGIGILLSAGQPWTMILEEMSMAQIALAAECISITRADFVRTFFLSPLEKVVEGITGGKMEGDGPEIATERIARLKKGKTGRRKGKKKNRTPEERDASLYRAAALMGIPIEEEGPKR